MTADLSWLYSPSKALNREALDLAQARQETLTKPMGSLGELERLAVSFAAWSGDERPSLDNLLIRVFAADHGVCQQGVSAFPQEVTAQMIFNFMQGGAAISVLARELDADFAVVNMGTVTALPDADNLVNLQIANGTADFTLQAAMSEQVLADCLEAGRQQASQSSAQLFIAGDMGIGNTTSASAIYSAILGLPAEHTVGPGTGIDQAGITQKQLVVQRALARHQHRLDDPVEILRCLGGLEIAAMVGAYLASAQNGTPVLLDGFISTAAALLASAINPSTREWMIFGHRSAEPAHVKALDHLHARPLLDLGMRLGEGSGAALAVPLLQSALKLHNNMATFADAGVSDAQ